MCFSCIVLYLLSSNLLLSHLCAHPHAHTPSLAFLNTLWLPNPPCTHSIRYRPSMLKFEGSDQTLGVCASARFMPAFLNQDIITLLSCRGASDQAFLHLQVWWVYQGEGSAGCGGCTRGRGVRGVGVVPGGGEWWVWGVYTCLYGVQIQAYTTCQCLYNIHIHACTTCTSMPIHTMHIHAYTHHTHYHLPTQKLQLDQLKAMVHDGEEAQKVLRQYEGVGGGGWGGWSGRCGCGVLWWYRILSSRTTHPPHS